MNVNRRGFLQVCGALFGATIATPIFGFNPTPEAILPSTPEVAYRRLFASGLNAELQRTYIDFIKELPPIDAISRRDLQERFVRVLNSFHQRRELYQFLVVCDDTNNPNSVIEANDIIADVYYQITGSWWTITKLTFSINELNNA